MQTFPTLPSIAVQVALEAAWRRSDALFDVVAGALHERPIGLRHPFVFYLGHLPAFAWNQVGRGALGLGDLDPALDQLFERGIDPQDGDEAQRAQVERWPALEVILAYRDRARAELRRLVPELDRDPSDPLRARRRALHVVLEHELMHHETLCYMLRELDHDRKRKPIGVAPRRAGRDPGEERVEVSGGEATLGADLGELEFGWDNEFPARRVEVEAFALDRWPVTNARFAAFVEGGGYDDGQWWSEGDWRWLRGEGRRAPHGWRREGGRWLVRATFEDVELDVAAAWPAIVSQAEASAYARWRGARLPTEPELYRAAHGTPSGEERSFPWGEDPPEPRHGNFGFRSFDPLPAGSHPDGDSAFGAGELVGNGWEWTSTVWAPHPGFRPWIRSYAGYSADFFDGRHVALFGGAWPTDERLLRRSFRNWFQRRYPYVFAKFRLAWERGL